MSRRTKRVIRELRNYETDKKDINESGIYIHYDESDLTVIQCLIFGPTETPYHNIPFIFAKFGYGKKQDWTKISVFKTISSLKDIKEGF